MMSHAANPSSVSVPCDTTAIDALSRMQFADSLIGYARDGSLRGPYEATLAARIHEPTFRHLVGDAIVTKARIIKDLGNTAVHETRAVGPEKAVAAVRELFHVAYWLMRTYARGTKPSPGLVFSPQGLPRTTQVSAATLKQLQDAAQKFEERTKALAEAEQQRLASETQRVALEAELAALRRHGRTAVRLSG